MADMLEEGMAELGALLKQHASRQVVYADGACEVAVQATIGRTLLKLGDAGGGVQMVWTDRDFLIQAADLVLAGVQVLPKRGARIRETVGAEVQVFEVLAPGDEPVWRWSDGFRTRLRIHTKFVGREL